MNKVPYRYGQFFVLILSLFVLSGSYYFQYMDEMLPCPLCLMQRFCTVFIALFSLAAWIWTGPPTRILTLFQWAFCLLGIYFASRQIWLMAFVKEDTGACLPGLDIMLRYFPWQDTLHTLIFGSADCSRIQWTWLGLPMPVWSLGYFLSVFFLVFLLRRKHLKDTTL